MHGSCSDDSGFEEERAGGGPGPTGGVNKLSSPDAKVKQQHALVEFKAGYSNGSCCSFSSA